MTPSQVKMIAFFYENVAKDPNDRPFIDNLYWREVTYELSDEEYEELSRIYNLNAPNLSSDLEVVNDILSILKKIESCQYTFVDSDGEPVLNGYRQKISGEL